MIETDALFELLSNVVDKISKLESPNVSKSTAFKAVFELSTQGEVSKLRNFVIEKSIVALTNKINDEAPELTFASLLSFSHIFNFYNSFNSVISSLFHSIERYSPPKSPKISEEIQNVFISLMKERFPLHFLLSLFTTEMNSMRQISNISHNTDVYSIVMDEGKLLNLVYSEKKDEIIRALVEDEYSNVSNFLSSSTPEYFVENALEFLINERSMIVEIFGKIFEIETTKVLYSEIVHSPHFDSSLQEMSNRLNQRDKSITKSLFDIITFINPFPDTVQQFNKAIENALNNEESELLKVAETVDFYESLVSNELCSSKIFAGDIEKLIIDYVNRDPINLIKAVLKFIVKVSKSTADLKQIQEVIKRMSNKGELELLHTRSATKRLLPLGINKIEKERKLMLQLNGITNKLKFKTLTKILNDATASLDYHIGPIMFIYTTLWPFSPPFFKPLRLKPITDEIAVKYKAIYSSRMLLFPIQSWNIVMKDTKRNFSIVCNGVQAEILLFLNKSHQVSSNSFVPDFPEKVVRAVLTTLSSDKYPILKNSATGDTYEVSDVVPKNSVVKLPNFSIAHSSPQIKMARFESIDASLARVLKRNKKMETADLVSQTFVEVQEKFTVSEDEIKNRIDTLVERGYIGLEGSVSIYLP